MNQKDSLEINGFSQPLVLAEDSEEETCIITDSLEEENIREIDTKVPDISSTCIVPETSTDDDGMIPPSPEASEPPTLIYEGPNHSDETNSKFFNEKTVVLNSPDLKLTRNVSLLQRITFSQDLSETPVETRQHLEEYVKRNLPENDESLNEENRKRQGDDMECPTNKRLKEGMEENGLSETPSLAPPLSPGDIVTGGSYRLMLKRDKIKCPESPRSIYFKKQLSNNIKKDGEELNSSVVNESKSEKDLNLSFSPILTSSAGRNSQQLEKPPLYGALSLNNQWDSSLSESEPEMIGSQWKLQLSEKMNTEPMESPKEDVLVEENLPNVSLKVQKGNETIETAVGKVEGTIEKMEDQIASDVLQSTEALHHNSVASNNSGSIFDTTTSSKTSPTEPSHLGKCSTLTNSLGNQTTVQKSLYNVLRHQGNLDKSSCVIPKNAYAKYHTITFRELLYLNGNVFCIDSVQITTKDFKEEVNISSSSLSSAPSRSTSGELGDVSSLPSSKTSSSEHISSMCSDKTTVVAQSRVLIPETNFSPQSNGIFTVPGKTPAKRRVGRPPKNRNSNDSSSSSSGDCSSTLVEVKTFEKDLKEEKATTPKKKEETFHFCSPEVPLPVKLGQGIYKGLRVLALWKSQYYYPGVVTKELSSASWEVKFDDGFVGKVNQVHLLQESLLQEGVKVLVLLPNSYYENGTLKGIFWEQEGKKGYEVLLENGATKRYAKQDIILSSEEANKIRSRNQLENPSLARVSLANLVEGKRKRTPTKLSFFTERRKRIPKNSLDPNLQDSTDHSSCNTEEEETVTPRKGLMVGRFRKVLKLSPKNLPKDVLPVQNLRKSPRKKDSPTLDASKSPNTKKLFGGLYFLISCADPLKAMPYDVSDMSNEEGTIDNQVQSRQEIMEDILSEGGTVLETFEEAQLVPIRRVFLVANSYLRTLKYIKCLAAGIRCIDSIWVTNSKLARKCLDIQSYSLSAGYSIIEEDEIPWPKEHGLLKGKEILLISKINPDEFEETWKPVLLAAQAETVHNNITESSSVSYVVTNYSCPEEVIRYANNLGVPVVSTEWVIQCLIHSKILPWNQHEKFRYTYQKECS